MLATMPIISAFTTMGLRENNLDEPDAQSLSDIAFNPHTYMSNIHLH
jgi:hypothetical protein